jgi:hypothetical protein
MVNLMTIKKSIAITLFSIGLAFAAQVGATGLGPVVSQAYEVALSNFTAPATTNGGVSFQECDECERMTVRVTSNTRYTVSGRVVRLEEFKKAIFNVPNRKGVAVTVLHHLESDTIKSIDVSL